MLPPQQANERAVVCLTGLNGLVKYYVSGKAKVHGEQRQIQVCATTHFPRPYYAGPGAGRGWGADRLVDTTTAEMEVTLLCRWMDEYERLVQVVAAMHTPFYFTSIRDRINFRADAMRRCRSCHSARFSGT
jgi:hypothetical protein